jgi:hypothetical protein
LVTVGQREMPLQKNITFPSDRPDILHFLCKFAFEMIKSYYYGLTYH